MEAAQFHFWEYINGNQTFILDSQWPFICSVAAGHLVVLFKFFVNKCWGPGMIVPEPNKTSGLSFLPDLTRKNK
jgi:hypothetical protein